MIQPHTPTAPTPTPDGIMKLGTAFWASKVLLSAVELGLFTELAKGPLPAEALQHRLGLHPRSALDFFDALVSLGMLHRDEHGYHNTAETEVFLDRNKPSYVGGLLEMFNARLFGFWDDLTEGLQTGEMQNEAKGGDDFFGELYAHPKRLQGFLEGMTGISMGPAMALAESFPWTDYSSVCDLGSAQGVVTAHLLRTHEHLRGVGYDLPPVGPIFDEYVAEHGVADRLRFHAGDFFADKTFPKADVYVYGHILHDWTVEQRKALIQKAYDSLDEGGALIVYGTLIDDNRRENTMGLLMSLNMLIETPGGSDYTFAECRAWMEEAGFTATRAEHLAGPESMVVGIK